MTSISPPLRDPPGDGEAPGVEPDDGSVDTRIDAAPPGPPADGEFGPLPPKLNVNMLPPEAGSIPPRDPSCMALRKLASTIVFNIFCVVRSTEESMSVESWLSFRSLAEVLDSSSITCATKPPLHLGQMNSSPDKVPI